MKKHGILYKENENAWTEVSIVEILYNVIQHQVCKHIISLGV